MRSAPDEAFADSKKIFFDNCKNQVGRRGKAREGPCGRADCEGLRGEDESEGEGEGGSRSREDMKRAKVGGKRAEGRKLSLVRLGSFEGGCWFES